MVLEDFFQSLPSEHVFVQVLSRFDTIVDAMDEYVLGVLRDVEQGECVRTIVVSPFDYRELIANWREGGRKLLASNYGDKHAVYRAAPLSDVEIRSHSAAADLPRHVLAHIISFSGGYPELFETAVNTWSTHHAEAWPRVRNRIDDGVTDRIEALVRKFRELDSTGRFGDALTGWLMDRSDQEARLELGAHPWWGVLFDEDGRPRADALPRAVFRQLPGLNRPARLFQVAAATYRAGAYRDAQSLLSMSATVVHGTVSKLLGCHARVMECIENVLTDLDPAGLRHAIDAARAAASGLTFRDGEDAILAARYREIESVASSIAAARERGTPRIVDVLAGCSGRTSVDPKLAVAMLVARIMAAERRPSPTGAVDEALKIPEQAFRIWAAWQVGVRQDCAPDDVGSSWLALGLQEFETPIPGEPFQAFPHFAKFALRLAISRSMIALPERNEAELDRALAQLEPRRHSAHALATVSEGARKSFFEVGWRWVRVLCEPCAIHEERFIEDDLLALFSPLPIPTLNGDLEWL